MTQVARSVGRYELLEEIGRGGMAVVYRARQTDLRRLVAVKELGALHSPDRSLAQRFVFEARLAGSLSHPNIVTVFDFFEHAGIPYIAMEYLPRGSLRPYLRNLTLAQSAGVFEGLLAGLAHAEEDGVVHRDLKPENLLVSRDGRVKIADFGIAKASGDVQTGGFRTATGTTVGTPAYMAPEQALGQELGPWTDLYAVGVMAFELFTGRVPFADAQTPMAVMFRHIEEPIPPVRTLNPTVHQAISDWIERLLVKDPLLRTRSAASAWEELEEIVIDVLGPRWRRNAQLTEPAESAPEHAAATTTDQPATPRTYETFRRDDPPAPGTIPGPATPPPADLPAGPMMPSEPDVPVGPSTPLPLDAGAGAHPASAGAAAADPRVEDATIRPAAPPAAPRTPEPPAPEARTTAPRTPEPATPDRRRASGAGTPRPNRRALVAGGGVLAVLVVAAVIALSGGGQNAPSGAAREAALAAGPVSVRLPAGWQPTAAPAATADLDLASPAAAAPAGNPARGSVTIGLGPPSASNASLLRPAFADGLAASPAAARESVDDLPGGLAAYRYDRLQPRGDGPRLTVYAAPTSAGIATIACAAPAPAAACAQIARALAVDGATPFPVGASAAYATRVNQSLRQLATALARSNANLGAAGTARAQANAASAVAAAYQASSRPLTSLDLSPADVSANAALLAAMNRATRAYSTLARAARAGRRGIYRRAANQARGAQAAIAAALSELTSHGYAGRITERFRPRAVPGLKRRARAARVVVPVTPVPPPPPAVITPPAAVTPPPPPPPEKKKPVFVP